MKKAHWPLGLALTIWWGSGLWLAQAESPPPDPSWVRSAVIPGVSLTHPGDWKVDGATAGRAHVTADAERLEGICHSGRNPTTHVADTNSATVIHASIGDSVDRAMPLEVWDALSAEDWEFMRTRTEQEFKKMLAPYGELLPPVATEKTFVDGRAGAQISYRFKPTEFGGGAELIVQRWEVPDRGAGADGADRILYFCFAYPASSAADGGKVWASIMSSVRIERLQ